MVALGLLFPLPATAAMAEAAAAPAETTASDDCACPDEHNAARDGIVTDDINCDAALDCLFACVSTPAAFFDSDTARLDGPSVQSPVGHPRDVTIGGMGCPPFRPPIPLTLT